MKVDIVKDDKMPDSVSFVDLVIGEVFRLERGKSYYMKVRLRHDKNPDGTEKYRMLELATGDAFPPSSGGCLILESGCTIKD